MYNYLPLDSHKFRYDLLNWILSVGFPSKKEMKVHKQRRPVIRRLPLLVFSQWNWLIQRTRMSFFKSAVKLGNEKSGMGIYWCGAARGLSSKASGSMVNITMLPNEWWCILVCRHARWNACWIGTVPLIHGDWWVQLHDCTAIAAKWALQQWFLAL